MKTQISESQFQIAISGLSIGNQTKEIAYGVLVKGNSQSSYAAEFGITKGAVSQAVKRVWKAHKEKSIPCGYERVTAVLPKRKAFMVKRWKKI